MSKLFFFFIPFRLIKQVYETAKKEGMLIRQKQITNDPIFQRSSNYVNNAINIYSYNSY